MRTALILAFIFLTAVVQGINCNEIGDNGTIYSDTVLTEDISTEDSCLVIIGDNVTLDCKGHMINGAGGGNGVKVFGTNGAVVKNCKIRSFDYGIYVLQSSQTSLNGNDVQDSRIGVYLSSTSDIRMSENIIKKNGKGIYSYSLTTGTIERNTITENINHGIELKSSVYTSVVENGVTDNSIGIGVYSSVGIIINGNDLRGCHSGIKKDSVRDMEEYGNYGDFVTGETVDDVLTDIRIISAFALLFVSLFTFVYIYGRRKKEEKGTSFKKLGVDRASGWIDRRKKKV